MQVQLDEIWSDVLSKMRGVRSSQMTVHEAHQVIEKETGLRLMVLSPLRAEEAWGDALDVVFPVLETNPRLVEAFLTCAPAGVDQLLLSVLRDMQGSITVA